MTQDSLIIDERYRVLHSLGEGLFGEVYLVRDAAGGDWALKLLKAGLKNLNQVETLSIFKKEFLLLRELHHPGIARIGDFGLDHALARYYFTSEYIAGCDLWEASKAASIEEIEELVVQALRALQYLHQYGIVHGDLKPENMLVKTQGEFQLKLIDFGVAAFKEPGKIMGSPTYIAPEIFLGAPPSPGTDLYALGVVVYTLLVRHNPFKGDSLAETIDRHKMLTPPPVHKLNPKVPIYFQHLLERLLDKNPASRYTQASAVIRDLNFLSGKHYAIETELSRHAYLPSSKKLLGREKEMQTFTSLFQAAFKQENSDTQRLIILAAETGLGKSRLLQEFKTHAQVNDVVVESIHKAEPFDLTPGKLFLIPDLASFSEALILDALRQAMGQKVLLVAALAGPVLDWHRRLPSTTILELAAFARGDIGCLLAELFRNLSLREEFVETIFSLTQGNPLMVEEIAHRLLDEAWKFDATGKWDEETIAYLSNYLKAAEVPNTLTDLLRARLEQLPDPTLFIVLALLDRPSSTNDIMDVLKEENLPQRFLALSAAAWLGRDPESGLWSIANPLLGKQMLADLSSDVRSAWEEKIGIMLAKKNEEDPLALDYLSRSSNADIARQAAERAYHCYWKKEEYALAVRFLDRLLKLSGDFPIEQVVAFQMAKSDCLSAMRQLEEAVVLLAHCLDELSRLPLTEGSLIQRLECLKKLGAVDLKLGHLSDALEAYQSGLTLASILKNGRVYRLFFDNAKAHVRVQEGSLEAALKIFHNTWQEWQTLPREEQALVLNHDLGRTLHLLGRYDAAIEQLQAELTCYKREANFFFEARTYYHLADTYLTLKNWDAAIAHFEQGIRIGQAHRLNELLIRLYNGLGNLHQLREDIQAGIDIYEKALRYTRKIQDMPAMAGVLTNLSVLYHRSGKTHDAFTHLTCAIHLINQLPLRRVYEFQCLARCHLELGEYYLNAREYKKAESNLREALSLATSHDGINSLLPWIFERLIRVALEAEPASEDIPEWFIAWEKAHPEARKEEAGAFNRLYQQWLKTHVQVPGRLQEKVEGGAGDPSSHVTYASDIESIEQVQDNFSTAPLERTAVVMTKVESQSGSRSLLSWREFETAYIAQALFDNRFHITKSAKSLKLTRATLYHKIHEYHLEKVNPLSLSLSVPLRVPMGLSLRQALFVYLYSVMDEKKNEKRKVSEILGVSHNRIDRLIGKGKAAGWDALLVK